MIDCLEQLARLGYNICLGDHTAGVVETRPSVASTLSRAAEWIDDGVWQWGGRASAEVTATLTITNNRHTAGEAVGIPMPE